MVDQGYTTFGYMQMQMVVAHGGRCAERIVFGDDITDGGRDDLEKITKVSRVLNFIPLFSPLFMRKLIDSIRYQNFNHNYIPPMLFTSDLQFMVFDTSVSVYITIFSLH